MKEPLKQTFGNLLSLADDVQKRNYFYKKTISLLHKKAEIDYNYANNIENLNKEYASNNSFSLASQVLYQKLLTLIQQEPKRITQMADKVMQSVTEMNELADNVSSKTKKSLDQAQKISKQILHLKEKLQKLKPRIERKTNELEQMKTEYLGSLLGNEQLQKKNDQYLQVGRMEHALKPILEEYNTLFAKYSESMSQIGSKFNSFMQSIEEVEMKKIAKIKSAVANYVYSYKLNLDSFLELYPFIRQEIDTVRQKEQLSRLNRDFLIFESQEVSEFAVREKGYIDDIFDRIEKKKNLQQLILYGQNIEHKKNLNSIADFNGQNRISACMPKTSRMINLFKCIFEEESTQEMIYEMETLFKGDQKLRKDFIFCLQKYRISNEFQLKLKNKEDINLCLDSFLNTCALELDTYNSKMLMLLSVTYHFKDGDRKIELQELIADHPIWKNIGWWQSALFQTIFQETRVKVKKQQVAINIWDIKAGGITRKQENEQATNQHICFNQLLYFVQNMNLFNIPPLTIWNYAKKNNQLLKLPEKLAKTVMNMCPEQFSPTKKDKGLSPQCGTP